jgi:hypothetical protein
MKITKTFGDLSIEAEFDHLEDVEMWLKRVVRWHEKMCPPIVLRGISPSKKELDVLREYVSKVGDPGELALWIQAEGKPHAMSWICKHSGFNNAKKLLAELERADILKWHECLYKGSNGHMQTMKGAFLDGAVPTPRAAQTDTVYKWVQNNTGYMSSYVEQNCGVVRSEARRILARLIADGELEMRTHATKPEKFGVWVR